MGSKVLKITQVNGEFLDGSFGKTGGGGGRWGNGGWGGFDALYVDGVLHGAWECVHAEHIVATAAGRPFIFECFRTIDFTEETFLHAFPANDVPELLSDIEPYMSPSRIFRDELRFDDEQFEEGSEEEHSERLFYHAVAIAQNAGLAAIIDPLKKFDPQKAELAGCNLDELLISQPKDSEELKGVAAMLVDADAVLAVFSLAYSSWNTLDRPIQEVRNMSEDEVQKKLRGL
jgi:hypothetical protein